MGFYKGLVAVLCCRLQYCQLRVYFWESGSSLTNETTISSLHLEGVLGNGTFLHDFLIILTKVGSGLFNNLPLIFAAAVALGMAKKAKEVAVLSSIIAFFVMHTTISGMLSIKWKYFR